MMQLLFRQAEIRFMALSVHLNPAGVLARFCWERPRARLAAQLDHGQRDLRRGKELGNRFGRRPGTCGLPPRSCPPEALLAAIFCCCVA
jgi:hypothetical protein